MHKVIQFFTNTVKVLIFSNFSVRRSPVIVLKDIKKFHMKALLTYIYLGEVQVHRKEISGFIRAAESLQIKGIGFPNSKFLNPKSSKSSKEVPDQNSNSGDFSVSYNSKNVVNDKKRSPSRKRQRKDVGNKSGNDSSFDKNENIKTPKPLKRPKKSLKKSKPSPSGKKNKKPDNKDPLDLNDDESGTEQGTEDNESNCSENEDYLTFSELDFIKEEPSEDFEVICAYPTSMEDESSELQEVSIDFFSYVLSESASRHGTEWYSREIF